ncbi:unnamed protein product [Discosporangium mesarthrocarpum]
MTSEGAVMEWYCAVTVLMASLCFLFRALLLLDAANSRISKAAIYVGPVEVAAWVLTWYSISVSMVVFNKWLLHEWRGQGFPFPTLATAIHMWLKVFISRGITCLKGGRPPGLEPSVQIMTVIPIGITTSLDILLSNLAFLYVTVSFYTIIKSGSIMWTALWAVVFKFEPATLQIGGVVTLMSLGLFLASFGETEFSLLGLFLILGASCLSGLRWGLVQLLQTVDTSCKDAVLVLYHISPVSALLVTPLAIYEVFTAGMLGLFVDEPLVLLEALGFVAAVGIVSYMLIASEVKLLSITSSLTMGVFGTLKEVIQIGVGILVFHEQVTALNIVGLGLAMLAGWAYKRTRHKDERAEGMLELEEVDISGYSHRRRGNGRGSRGQGTGGAVGYEPVSRQEVADELRVFKFNHTDWDLEGELEDFSSTESL